MSESINASDFKARCLALLDDVARTGKTLTILKHGKVVAQLVPAGERQEYPQDSLLGSVKVLGDIVSPCFDGQEWEAEAGLL